MKLEARATVVWLVLMATEFIHGTARTLFLAPRIGDFPARQVSVFTGSALMLGVVWLCTPWLGAKRRGTQWRIGIFWLAATVTFEVALGRVFGRSWESTASDFNLSEGGLLPLGLAVLTLSPLLAARMRGFKETRNA